MADGLLDSIDLVNSVHVTIRNFTEDDLFFHSAEHESGEFDEFAQPAGFIGHQSATDSFTTFTSHQKTPSFFTGTVGRVTYAIGEQQNTFLTVFWSNPAAGTNNAGTKLEGFHPGRYAVAPLSFPDSGSSFDIMVDLQPVGDLSGLPPLEIPPLDQPPIDPPPPLLRYGAVDVNGWVQHLQQLLTAAGHGPLTPDGDFGQATHNSVVSFQSARQLMVDGIAGEQTWAALLG